MVVLLDMLLSTILWTGVLLLGIISLRKYKIISCINIFKGLLSSKMGWPMDKQEQELCMIVTQ